MSEEWIPFHERLAEGPKKALPRAIRFVLLELSLKARSRRGVLDFPPTWSTLDAVHDRIGGNRQEIEAALEEFCNLDDPVIAIERTAKLHRLTILEWDKWAGPRTSTERSRDHRAKQRDATLAPLRPATNATPTGQERTGQDKTGEGNARAPEAPISGVFKSDRPPAVETEYDLGRRVFVELWEKKYKQQWFDPVAKLGPDSSDEAFRRIGHWSRETGAAMAEDYARHYWAGFLRDHGSKSILDEMRHPPSWAKDPNRYGMPPKAREAIPPPKLEPTVPRRLTKEEQQKTLELAAKAMGKSA